jgi:hypothetical protein
VCSSDLPDTKNHYRRESGMNLRRFGLSACRQANRAIRAADFGGAGGRMAAAWLR